MITELAVGLISKIPHGVERVLAARVLLEANAGRSVSNPSPLRSRPTLMLNGGPDESITNGDNDTPHFAVTLPPMNARWRTSNREREYSVLRSYWLEGKVLAPSLLPCACPYA